VANVSLSQLQSPFLKQRSNSSLAGAAEVVETQAEAASRGVGGVNDAANLASRSEPNKRGTGESKDAFIR